MICVNYAICVHWLYARIGSYPVFDVARRLGALWLPVQVFEDPPCSCQQGICTTCAGFIREGTRDENYKVAVDALGADQREKVGFPTICFCLAFDIQSALLNVFGICLWSRARRRLRLERRC